MSFMTQIGGIKRFSSLYTANLLANYLILVV
jgi:hypothetical protein